MRGRQRLGEMTGGSAVGPSLLCIPAVEPELHTSPCANTAQRRPPASLAWVQPPQCQCCWSYVFRKKMVAIS